MSVVSAARGQFDLERSNTTNELKNSLFENDNYPVWTAYNGEKYADDAKRQNGVYKGIASWLHYSPLFQGYSSYVGNQFLYHSQPYELAPFNSGFGPRIIKIYGVESLLYGVINNNDADRGSNIFGTFNNSNSCRVISNTTLTNIDSSTSMTTTDAWSRSTEWTQHLDIPDSATSVKFGAQVKVAPDDLLRPLNFAGVYCTQDRVESSLQTRYVNYFALRHTDATYTLPTGTKTGTEAAYNWNGLMQSSAISGNVYYYTPQQLHITQHAMLDQNNYSDFQKVEYTFTPQSGTDRKMSLSLFFAENTSYLAAAAGEFTGGFQVYDPFVEFS